MHPNSPPRPPSRRASALDEIILGFTATAVLIVAFGGVYATTLVLGSEAPGVYPLAALVGVTIFVAVPVGASLLWRTAAARFEAVRDRRSDRADDTGFEPETEPGPIHPDARRIEE